MDANPEQAPETPDIPEMEQGMQDTPQDSNSINFNEMIGIPTPEESEVPQSTEPAPPVVDNPEPTNFSQNEVAPQGQENDQVRFEYWQSQAAKLQNQVDEMKEYQPMVDYLRTNPEAVQSLTPGVKQEAPTSQESQTEEFPPPPDRPEQPHGFSKEEAFTDPTSASAVHMNEMDTWRDNMTQYNSLASQYQVAVMRESYDKKIKALEEVEGQRQEQTQAQEKMAEVRSYVTDKYDLGENVDDFITTMNDPSSINMDDLVGYYKFKKGMANNAPQPARIPSNTFNQVKRAQSVPTPMGVQPAQGNAQSEPSNDFMDALLKNDNKHNIL